MTDNDVFIQMRIIETIGSREMTINDISQRLKLKTMEAERILKNLVSGGVVMSSNLQGTRIYSKAMEETP